MSRAVAEAARPIRLDLNLLPTLNVAALRRVLAAPALEEIAMYPEPDAPRLRSALSALLKAAPEAILVGNGSDELIDLLVRALVPAGGSIGVLNPSFGIYDHAARASGAAILRVPLRDMLPVDPLASSDSDAFFLPSPNNPTGTVFPRKAFEALLERVSGPVIVDEAYAEFARQDYRSLGTAYGNAIVLRTFSKAYGLPGIRIGYAIGSPELLAKVRALKMPYNITSLGERAALAALADPSFVEEAVSLVEAERSKVYETLRTAGWPVWPSRANFHFVGPLRRAADIHAALRERRIVVKLVDWPGGEGGQSLRIGVGSAEQNAALLEALREVASWRA